MLFMVSWRERESASQADRYEAGRAGLQVFSKWAPAEGSNFKAFLSRSDGRGGYALVEADSLAPLLEDAVKFADFFEFEHVPVIDMMEAGPIFFSAVEWRDSVSQ